MNRLSTAGKIGALWGLVFGLLLAVWIAIVNTRPPESNPFGGIALGLVFIVPFVFATAALRIDPVLRAGIWIGSGILALLLSFVSLVTLGLLPASFLLLFGGFRTLGDLNAGRAGLVLTLAHGLVVAGAGAFSALMVGREPACWVLEETSAGERWRRIPATTTLSLGSGQRAGQCTELISPEASILSLAIWGASALGLYASARRGQARTLSGEVSS